MLGTLEGGLFGKTLAGPLGLWTGGDWNDGGGDGGGPGLPPPVMTFALGGGCLLGGFCRGLPPMLLPTLGGALTFTSVLILC